MFKKINGFHIEWNYYTYFILKNHEKHMSWKLIVSDGQLWDKSNNMLYVTGTKESHKIFAGKQLLSHCGSSCREDKAFHDFPIFMKHCVMLNTMALKVQ